MYPSLVLVQPRKTRPCLTERLLMGRKESNQTNKLPAYIFSVITSILDQTDTQLLSLGSAVAQ